ncbi:MAG: metalloregulator ArsR/SmtB family transcription factor [Rhodospirillaceae bacterium]|nr:metalloregulator ArsR/SmtB family transcription factor [Rhodospirillaceae bacterium]MDD9914885.1 metalloregulator ArsR/SmtB family transcription factor [Rhodospirillaceae bacterium]
MPSTQTDPLSAAFGALADPTRRAILERLSDGETAVGDLAEPFAISAPAISRHLKVLEEAGLVARRTDRQRRIIRLQPDRLREISGWVDRYRRFWEGKLDALADYLEQQENKP